MESRAFDHSKYKDWIDPRAVTPYERNAKKHPPEQVARIRASIDRFGWQQDCVLSADNVLVIGHGRRLAALEIGCEMPYHRVGKNADELTEEEINALRLADNRTNESEWDFGTLDDVLAEFQTVDMAEFGFDDVKKTWFDRKQRDGNERQEGNEEYNEFLDKFDPKKTTDDCYTPDIVYEAVAGWVAEEYGLAKADFVRPFFPDGDYKNHFYPTGCVVVDNPPFSILAEIIAWYREHDIKFFLFAPQLTLFSSSSSSCCLPCGVDITYENGAVVPTSFITNLEDNRIRIIPKLYNTVEMANNKNLEATKRTLPKYKYPDYVITAAMCNYMCAHGQALTITKHDSQHIRYLDSQKEYGGKAIFGSGFLLSEKAAAEKAAAHVWELSEREWEIIKSLG